MARDRRMPVRTRVLAVCALLGLGLLAAAAAGIGRSAWRAAPLAPSLPSVTDAAQANATICCLAGDEQAGQQAADAAEAVEDDVGARLTPTTGSSDDVTELGAQEVLEGDVTTDLETTPVQPGAKPGDMRYQDTNGDGVITGADNTYLGSGTPDFSYGASLNLS